MQRYNDDTRVCPHCEDEFTPNSSKQTYCSNSCRVSAHKAKSKQEVEHLIDLVNDQAEMLETLNSTPHTRKEVTQEVNSEWQLLKQKVDAQQAISADTAMRLSQLRTEATELVSTSPGRRIGLILGLFLSAIPIAIAYDNRNHRSMSVTFLVSSLVGLLVGGLLGYYLGNTINSWVVYSDKQRMNLLSHNQTQQDTHNRQLSSEKKVLTSLQQALVETPKFTRETIVYTD